MKQGLQQLLGNGTRFFTSAVASTYVGLRNTADPATSFYINLLTTLPGSTSALTIDASGNMGTAALGNGGTVTSVSTGSLSPLFTAAIANPTTTPALSFALSNQAINTVFAGGASGGAAAPTFRALVAADIPQTLTASYITNFDTQVRTSRLDQMAVPTAALSLGGQVINNLAMAGSPASTDAANVSYVQSFVQGIQTKLAARVATTANITLTGTQTIDGVAVSAGDIVLVKNQTTAANNGLYVVAAGAWARPSNFSTSANIVDGTYIFIEEGTVYAKTGFTLSTDTYTAVTVGTTNLSFTQFFGIGTYTGSGAIALTGTQFSLNFSTNTLALNGSNLIISGGAAGYPLISGGAGVEATYSALNLATAGVVTGALPVANGGTGASTAATARTNLSAAGIYRTTFTNATLASGVLTINPGLGQQYGSLVIVDNNNQQVIPDNLTFTSATSWSADLTSYGTLVGNYQAIALA